MTPEGYELVRAKLGPALRISPQPYGDEDVRFVHFQEYPGDATSIEGVTKHPVTHALNRLAAAGLMEYHGSRDIYQQREADRRPAFRLLSIDNGIVYLEDTNSRLH